jgi:hypothetical protein
LGTALGTFAGGSGGAIVGGMIEPGPTGTPIGQEDNGEYRKGQACRWEATDYLRSIAEVDEEEVVEGAIPMEGRGEEHIYGHNTIRFNPDTIPDYLRDEVQYWESPHFAGYVGQMTSQAA